MKCKICMYKTEQEVDLAEHMLGIHEDYFAERPEPRELWRQKIVEHYKARLV